MSEIDEETIAGIVRSAMLSDPRDGTFRERLEDRTLISTEAARQILALVLPAIERARPAYSITEPEGGFRAHGSFTPDEKAKLRPIAETLAMLDGNAFFGMDGGELEDWSDQYLPEAAALYESNGGDGGWAGKASFAAAIRKG